MTSNRNLIRIGLTIYSMTILVVLGLLNDHVSCPGKSSAVLGNLTAEICKASGIESGKRALLLVINPKCPCSSVTVENLLSIIPNGNHEIQFRIVCEFDSPNDMQILGQSNLSSATYVMDLNGSVADRLGVTTSGHVLLFDENGKLNFSGGVTAGRGHRGDCVPLQHLVSLLGSNHSNRQACHFPVWGCDLRLDVHGKRSGP